MCHTEAERENTLSQVAYLAKPTKDMLLTFRDTFAASLSDLPPLPPLDPPITSLVGTEIEDLHKLLEGFRVRTIDKFENQLAFMNGPTLANLKLAAPRIEATRFKRVLPTGVQHHMQFVAFSYQHIRKCKCRFPYDPRRCIYLHKLLEQSRN